MNKMYDLQMEVKSSNPKITTPYVVSRIRATGQFVCSCGDFVNRKQHTGEYCKHIVKVNANLPDIARKEAKLPGTRITKGELKTAVEKGLQVAGYYYASDYVSNLVVDKVVALLKSKF